jgi:PII-like signaling protein
VKIEGTGLLARIYVGESDQWHGRPLYEAVVHLLRDRGLAGATVLRGIEGFGAKQHIHTTRILSLSSDLPVLIEIVDQEDRLRAVLPDLDAMVTDGLITLERVEVIAYRAAGSQHEVEP